MNKLITQITALSDGYCKALYITPEGNAIPCEKYEQYKECSYYILSTSANPLHYGHIHMANFVPTVRDTNDGMTINCEFELSMSNVDKPDFSIQEVYDRVQQFIYLGRVCWITRFATFVQKSYFFQDCEFIVGTDTINRVVDPKYYYDSIEERDRVIDTIENNGCCFMILGRHGYRLDPNHFNKVDDSGMFRIEEYNGINISSTEIRKEKSKETNIQSDQRMYRPKRCIYVN